MTVLRKIVILTGAGCSAESGIDTFRANDNNGGGGLWEQHRVEDVATPEAFERDPDLVLRFYDMRREAIQTKQPNAAHLALARLEREWHAAGRGTVTLVTQNVDDLHDRAGSRNLIHMHGEHLKAWCLACDSRFGWRGALIEPVSGEDPETGQARAASERSQGADASASSRLAQRRPECPVCGEPALRPDIVWFGEMPYRMDEIHAALREADLFVSIGTSGAVYPAAGFVRGAREVRARCLELNLEESQGSRWFHESRLGPAGELVPAWVEQMLAG